jgi:phospholipid/cholesterol/gamma-HCH transport system ATP-binding protein
MTEDELDDYRKSVGVLFPERSALQFHVGRDNVALPLREHTDLPEATIEIMVKIKLELVGLRNTRTKCPAMLSGGMKKRAGLARAMAWTPRFFFTMSRRRAWTRSPARKSTS